MSPAQPPPPHTALPVPVEKPQPQQQQPSRAKLPPMTSEEEVAVGTEEEVAAAAASPSAAAEATAEGGQVVGDGGSPLLADVDTLEVHLKFSAEQRRAMSVGQLAHSLALQVCVGGGGCGGRGMRGDSLVDCSTRQCPACSSLAPHSRPPLRPSAAPHLPPRHPACQH